MVNFTSERAHSADLQQTIRKFRTALEDLKDQNMQLEEAKKQEEERSEGIFANRIFLVSRMLRSLKPHFLFSVNYIFNH